MGAAVRTQRYKNGSIQSTSYEIIPTNGTGVYHVPVVESSDEDEIRVCIVDSVDNSIIYSEEKTISIQDHCDNAILLSWSDVTGGMNHWVFDVSQEYSFSYENGKKAKRKRLFANNLTLNQWETINGLNTLGEIYRNNIVELTTSVLKTSSRIGQQVYATENDETVGVIVIPTENITNTRQVKHSIEITIEYPEIFLQ